MFLKGFILNIFTLSTTNQKGRPSSRYDVDLVVERNVRIPSGALLER